MWVSDDDAHGWIVVQAGSMRSSLPLLLCSLSFQKSEKCPTLRALDRIQLRVKWLRCPKLLPLPYYYIYYYYYYFDRIHKQKLFCVCNHVVLADPWFEQASFSVLQISEDTTGTARVASFSCSVSLCDLVMSGGVESATMAELPIQDRKLCSVTAHSSAAICWLLKSCSVAKAWGALVRSV